MLSCYGLMKCMCVCVAGVVMWCCGGVTHCEDSATVTASVSSAWLSGGNVVDASAVALAVGVSQDRVSNVQLTPARRQAVFSLAAQRGNTGKHGSGMGAVHDGDP